MKPEDMPSEVVQGDEQMEQALDQLGKLVAPRTAAENDFVLRVMHRIQSASMELRKPVRAGRWILGSVLGIAGCLAIALTLWHTMAAGHPAPLIVTSGKQVEPAPVSPSVDPMPIVRTSTWTTVSEGVVVQRDVPVRALLYREFERVELLDSQGNAESHLIVPTKAMLVATKEQY
jgi:hypothetical protein